MSDHSSNSMSVESSQPDSGSEPVTSVGPEAEATASEAAAESPAQPESNPESNTEPPDAEAAGADGAKPPSPEAEAAGAKPPSPEAEAAARIAQLEADKAALEQEKQDHWNRFLRATADADNVRKRSKRDIEEARIEARTRVLKEMLPVIDNLERALEHAEKSGANEDAEASAVVEGVKLVLRQFKQALERCGVVPVDALEKPFDPNLHEAIAQVESAEHTAGTVMQVLQKGYKIGERLLRPSLVVVTKAPPAPQETPAAAEAGDHADDDPEAAGSDTGESQEA